MWLKLAMQTKPDNHTPSGMYEAFPRKKRSMSASKKFQTVLQPALL